MDSRKSWFYAAALVAALFICSTFAAGQEQKPPLHAFSSIVHSGLYMPATKEVPVGHYSGITYLGGTRYAVVDDKLPGGGIVMFDIVIANDGTIVSAKADIAQGTLLSSVSGKDNEGIAFVSKNSALFVCSEAGQTIAEYSIEGNPTGFELSVPECFAKDRIFPDNGFEALSYSNTTGLFWTTTECPLPVDGKESRLLRLQSFAGSGEAAHSYLYKMDAPSVASSAQTAARAYVHGVPAITALDDGSLLVLEREVYVPNGGMLAMALRSFATVKIYRVIPGDYDAGIPDGESKYLLKILFTSFITASTGIADYEGMCLGPKLPDGRHTLVLIADSQGSSDGLVPEYIKVVTFR